MNNLLTIFIVVTAAAVLLQAGILFAMYFAMRKTSAKVESLAEEVKTKVLPTAELAHSMMSELRPKITTVVDNVSVSTTMCVPKWSVWMQLSPTLWTALGYR